MTKTFSPGFLKSIGKKSRLTSLTLSLLFCMGIQSTLSQGQASMHASPNVSITADATHGDTMTLRSQVVIDAPASIIWAAMTNYSGLKDIFPGYRKSQLVQNSPKLVDVTLSVSPFLPVYSYRIHVREFPQKFALQFTRVSGDFKEFTAAYQLIPKENGNKTLLVYQLRVDPGVRLPGREMILKSTTEKSLTALQSYAEQEYRKSVIGQR